MSINKSRLNKLLTILGIIGLLLPTPSYAGQRHSPYTQKQDFCNTIAEIDGSPSAHACQKILVGNGSLTDNADGTFTLSGVGSSVDISSESNLAATSPIVLTGDTLSLASLTDAHMSYSYTLAGNPALAVNRCYFASTGIICEGSTADSFEGLLTWAVTTSDKTLTLPNETGTVCSTGSICSGYMSSATDLWVNTTGDTMNGSLRMHDGTAGTPAIAFTNDTDTGLVNSSSEFWLSKDSELVWGLDTNSTHILTNGTSPSLSACGDSPTIMGNDSAGSFRAGSAAADCCTLTFADRWDNEPVCVCSSSSNKEPCYIQSVSVTTMTLCLGNSIDASDVNFYYHCAEGTNP